MKLKLTTTNLIFLLAVLLPSITHAQPGFGDDVNDVPVDGGLVLLITAGIGYGLKKLKMKKAYQKW